ncbi:site-2 protease family protein [Halosimplex halobium]|uniref:site-2 protease family protein n=1 Tax=Halosimplex halobium TaxID=3396618 RepID=UPI003F569F9C
MDERRVPAEGPPVEDIESVFQVADVRVGDDDAIYYLGTPLASAEALERELWGLFREAGYDVSLTTRAQSAAPFDERPAVEERFGPTRPQYVLVAEPRSPHIDGIPWTNLVFFVLTVLSTLYVGSIWYYVELDSPLALLEAWPFTAAILGVLAVHEFGHYVLIRYHDVDASLPYFIPFPSLIGTMGAVIRMRGRIPDRKALFDIGVSGPLAGLVATVVVTVVGLYLDPITVPERVVNGGGGAIRFNDPLLLVILAEATGQPLSYPDPRLAANPVIFGGWVGMFVTFLNLLPVGQFDGGHIVRAILGPRQETVAAAVPAALFGLAGYLYFAQDATNAVVLWVVWGVIAAGLAYAGPATPIRDDPIGPRRRVLGVVTLVLGLLCFTPVPFEILAP